MSTAAALGGRMFVGAEREVKKLFDAAFGAESPFGSRVFVGWPDAKWLADTALPRAVVSLRRWKIAGLLQNDIPEKTLEVEDEDYRETWYHRADAVMVIGISLQTRGRSVLTNDDGELVGGVDYLTGVLMTALEQGTVFPGSGEFAGQYQVSGELEGEELPPEESDAVRRVFERLVLLTVTGPLYEVRQEYLGDEFITDGVEVEE